MYEFCIIPGMIFCINMILIYRDVMNALRWQDTRIERLEHMTQFLTEMMDLEVIQKKSSIQSNSDSADTPTSSNPTVHNESTNPSIAQEIESSEMKDSIDKKKD
jgi:hypothetical protein